MSVTLNSHRESNLKNVKADQTSSSLNYVLILGKGRSGTTWLAQIMNSYEHCSYKHEPFLQKKSTDYNSWLSEIESGDVEELRHRFELQCRNCYHDVDMPPFPPKSFRWQNPKLLHLLYGTSKRVPTLKPLYEWFGRSTLTAQTPVLIKDVNFPQELLPRLSNILEPHILAVVRNPFSNISSYLKGVEMSLFGGSPKVELVRQALQKPVNQAFSHYLDRLETLSPAQLEALTWRIQVEPLAEFARSFDRGMVVVYEDLCNDPMGKTEEIFDFVGWELGKSTREFIDRSISGAKTNSKSSKSYYSVYRDPRQSLSKWKTQLTSEQIEDIASIIRESPIQDLWRDLPL
jgi:Sulfotransferase domain